MQLSRFVQASSDEVGGILESILDLVLRAGAEIHPDARLREEDGAMSVHCAAESDEGRLVRMPRALLVPVDGATWADSTTALRLESSPFGLTPIQRDLLDLHVALYNTSGKIPWVVENHPRMALRDEPALLAAVRALRPSFVGDWRSPAETFLSTRTYRLAPPDEGAQGTACRVLLPVIDLLNHHPDGARLGVDERAMTVATARTLPGDECFAHYGGRRDLLDLALQYGYVDRATRIARSAPVTIEIENAGEVRVNIANPGRKHPLDPPWIEVSESGLALSHLTFDARHPDRARTALAMAVKSLALRNQLSSEEANGVAEEAFSYVVRANSLLLERVTSLASGAPGASASVVAEAAAAQAALIASASART